MEGRWCCICWSMLLFCGFWFVYLLFFVKLCILAMWSINIYCFILFFYCNKSLKVDFIITWIQSLTYFVWCYSHNGFGYFIYSILCNLYHVVFWCAQSCCYEISLLLSQVGQIGYVVCILKSRFIMINIFKTLDFCKVLLWKKNGIFLFETKEKTDSG